MRRVGNRVQIAERDVRAFNHAWPCSPIEARPHWAEFDARGDLVDHDFTEAEDGSAALALIDEAQDYLLAGGVNV
jgi:hypothetical protein